MQPRKITREFCMVALAAGAMAISASSSARGAASEWCASSGVLPSDDSIPGQGRFVLLGEGSYVSLAGDVLEFNDPITQLRVVFQKTDVEFPAGGDWAFQIDLRMISHDRDTLDFGAEAAMDDGSRAVTFGVARDAIGFIDSPSTRWIENASFAMDTTDAMHAYRVVKTEAGGNAQVEVFVDDSPSPVLIVPYENLNPTGVVRVVLAATSIIGTARFDVRCFAFNTQGTGLSPCPADIDDSGAVDFGDVLAILAAWGSMGGPEDLDGSGVVGFGDLLVVLGAWGPCP